VTTSTTGRDQEEYSALRATIRERGTTRICLFAGGFVAWAALTAATAALASTPVASLLPLLTLAAVFEAVYALHIGVERIGRYLQVFYEDDEAGAMGWERAAMAFGRPRGAAALDPLFTVPFLLAAIFNIMPALLLEPTMQEVIFVAGAHVLFALRVAVARGTAARQRAIDVERFRTLKQQNSAR
jgi:hypothetical protein